MMNVINANITPETLATMPVEKLVELFELTTDINHPKIYEVRGWLMDAIEKKNPSGFDAWLSLDCPEDDQLKEYVI